MADVIPFAPRRRSASQGPAAVGPSGQILFFTGVRYERQVDPVPVEALRRRRRRSVARGKSAGQPV